MDTETIQTLKQNLSSVAERIAGACDRCGRKPSDVTLVGVTKSVDIDIAGALMDAGVEHVGENRIPEAERKHAALGDRGVWHMIGHLQRNKVRKALPLFSMIHSVDSLRLLMEIDSQCEKLNLTMEVLLEVNVSGEESKYGLTQDELHAILGQADAHPRVAIRGLMTMAPYVANPEETRPVFSGLREMMEEIRKQGLAGPDFNVLSMGMTNDFEVAIEEGATHVRVGTALYEGIER